MYDGTHVASQIPKIKDYFTELLVKENFNTVIEIGTQMGGLTYIINDIIKENNLGTVIHTFDIINRDFVVSECSKRGIKFHNMDEYTDEFKDLVVQLINEGGKTLVACDGGNKTYEFNMYSNFLKGGDIIMAHDYSYDEEYFNTYMKNKIWNWFEISYKHIEEAVIKNNLIKYDKVNFDDAAWACFSK